MKGLGVKLFRRKISSTHSIIHGESKCSIIFIPMIRLGLLSSFVCLSHGLRIGSTVGDISPLDSSNCTWSGWGECELESPTRCTKSRTFDVVPLEKQSEEFAGKEKCNGQGGNTQIESCSDGLCPHWSTGNWTDCSNTCNSTMRPWQGFQRRDVVCVDATEVLYRTEVCETLYGINMKPESEQACECSHKLKPYDAYATTYRPVDA